VSPAPSPLRLVVVTTHPIQYQVPWIRGLSAWSGFDVHTLFGMLPDAEQQGTGFGVAFRWDQPLLEGYAWSALTNRARRPSLARRSGIDTPDVGEHLARLAPDAVLVCGWQSRALVQAARAAWRLRVATLVRGESNALRPRAWWKRLLHRRYLGRFDGALAIGRSNAEFLRQAGVPAARLFFSRYGVDDRHLAPVLARRDDLRREARARWGIASAAVVALFVGKLQAKKRPLDLVQALGRLAQGPRPVHLLMVGAGELETQARAEAQRQGLSATFAGFLNQSELAGAYAAADLLVLPSDHGETWGLVVNEAQICALPVVVSDQVGCGPDLVEEGVTGFTYPCGDVAALAERIERLAADVPARARMGAAGRARVADFSIAKAVEGAAEGIATVVTRLRAAGVRRV